MHGLFLFTGAIGNRLPGCLPIDMQDSPDDENPPRDDDPELPEDVDVTEEPPGDDDRSC